MTDQTNPSKIGRPSEYQDKYPALIRLYRSNGYEVSAFCSEVGISRDSYYRWVEKYPDFGEAHRIGKEDYKAFYLNEGLKGMKVVRNGAEELNEKIWKELKNNPSSIEQTELAQPGTQITIGSMNVLQQLSSDDLQKRINAQLEACQIPVLKEDNGRPGTESEGSD